MPFLWVHLDGPGCCFLKKFGSLPSLTHLRARATLQGRESRMFRCFRKPCILRVAAGFCTMFCSNGTRNEIDTMFSHPLHTLVCLGGESFFFQV